MFRKMFEPIEILQENFSVKKTFDTNFQTNFRKKNQ